MDVGTHLRAIWQRRYLVVGGAAVLAIAVFFLRSLAPTSYASSAVLFVVPGGGDSRDVQGDVRRLSSIYADLIDDPEVLAATAERVEGMSAQEVDQLTSVSGAGDAQITVTATAPTAEDAAALANAASNALAEGADREQVQSLERELAPLEAEIDEIERERASPGAEARAGQLAARLAAAEQARVERLNTAQSRLDVVNSARPSGAVASPQPLRDAVLVFLLAFIIEAEAAALLAARRAGLEGQDPIKVLRQWTDLPVFRVGESKRGPDQSAAALLHARPDTPGPFDAFIVSLAFLRSDEAAIDTSLRHVVQAGTTLCSHATVVELGASHEPPGTERTIVMRLAREQVEAIVRGAVQPRAWRPFAVLVGDGWEESNFLLLTAAVASATFVVVDAATVRRPEVQQAVDTLRDARIAPAGILVVESSGRRGRGPAATPDAAVAEGSAGPAVPRTDQKALAARPLQEDSAPAAPSLSTSDLTEEAAVSHGSPNGGGAAVHIPSRDT